MECARYAEDNNILFHQGPPFKFEKTISVHTKFVNSVRYNKDGSLFASVGSDQKVFIFDGKTGDKVREIEQKDGHTGTIYSLRSGGAPAVGSPCAPWLCAHRGAPARAAGAPMARRS